MIRHSQKVDFSEGAIINQDEWELLAIDPFHVVYVHHSSANRQPRREGVMQAQGEGLGSCDVPVFGLSGFDGNT